MLQRIKKATNQASKEKLIRRYYDSFQKFRQIFRDRVGLTAADPEVTTYMPLSKHLFTLSLFFLLCRMVVPVSFASLDV